MAQTFSDVLAEVNQIFRTVLDNDAIQLSYETTAKDVENWDSLNHIELVVAIEKHFNIKFNFAELQKFKNVGQMCDNIVARLNRSASA
jgi:acyl carrier protein